MPMFGKRAPNYFARPTVSAYTPTPRDQVANLFLRVAGDTYDNRRFARNLFGSSGIGGGGANPTGIGLMDLTPAGIPFQLNEAGAQIGAGRPVSGLANAALAVVPIPAAAKGARRMIGRGARRAAGKAKGIVAYHGSPHTFDAFDASKIGTGEGAQAYGHGLYFAENEAVANDYRKALTGNHAGDQFSPAVDGQRLEWTPALRGIQQHGGNAASFVQAMQPNLQRAQAAVANASDDLERMVAQSQLRDVQGIVNEAQGYVGKKVSVMPPGSMYQVRINADPEHFLDWDKPLREQSPSVRDAVNRVGRDVAPHGLDRVADDLRPVEMKRLFQSPEGTSRLSEHGVPGIKYLDQGSRGVGDGTRNYVVFDPKIIDIMKRYGVAAPVAAMIAAGQMRPPPTPSRP